MFITTIKAKNLHVYIKNNRNDWTAVINFMAALRIQLADMREHYTTLKKPIESTTGVQVFTVKAVWKSQITKSESKVISPTENLALSSTGGTPTCGPRLGGTSGPRPTYGHFPKACWSSRVKSLRPFMESPLLLICMRKCKTLWDKWFVNAAAIVCVNSDSDNKNPIYLHYCVYYFR